MVGIRELLRRCNWGESQVLPENMNKKQQVSLSAIDLPEDKASEYSEWRHPQETFNTPICPLDQEIAKRSRSSKRL